MSKFITVEGLDAAGKSSVIIPYLKEKLNNTVFVADMNTGKFESAVRAIFMDPELVTADTDWTTIALLASSARSNMVKQQIIPALNQKLNVVSDRYVDTSFVYNLKSDTVTVDKILNLSTHLVYPDIILFVYCSYEEMIERKKNRSDNDQWDLPDEDSYNQKLQRYRDQFNTRPNKVIEIDTSGSIEDLYKKLDELIIPLINV